MKLDILAIAVHPDDVELGCSGTLMMEKLRGKKTGAIDLTRGELGTRGTPELRTEESAKAAAIMQLDARENLGMADGFFMNDESHQRLLIRSIRKYVFHYIQDRYYNPSFVYDVTDVFERKLESIKAYASQFHSTEYNKDEPQTYISTPEFLSSIIGRHQMFGKMIGVAYAEGFISEKMIGVRSMDSFIQLDT